MDPRLPLLNDDALIVNGRGHLLDRDWLREMRADPGDRVGHPLHARPDVSDLSDTVADRCA